MAVLSAEQAKAGANVFAEQTLKKFDRGLSGRATEPLDPIRLSVLQRRIRDVQQLATLVPFDQQSEIDGRINKILAELPAQQREATATKAVDEMLKPLEDIAFPLNESYFAAVTRAWRRVAALRTNFEPAAWQTITSRVRTLFERFSPEDRTRFATSILQREAAGYASMGTETVNGASRSEILKTLDADFETKFSDIVRVYEKVADEIVDSGTLKVETQESLTELQSKLRDFIQSVLVKIQPTRQRIENEVLREVIFEATQHIQGIEDLLTVGLEAVHRSERSEAKPGVLGNAIDQLNKLYGTGLPNPEKGEINLETCTVEERRKFTFNLRNALWKVVLDKPFGASVTEKYPTQTTDVLNFPIISYKEGEILNKISLLDILDGLPAQIAPAYEWLRSQFLAVNIHHNRAQRFIGIFRSTDEKSIAKITLIYQQMADAEGGGNPFDMGALYSRNVPEGARELIGDEDIDWQVGNIANTAISLAVDLIKEDPVKYNPFPWTLQQAKRDVLEREIRRRLSAVNPPLQETQITAGIMLAFWEIRSFGLEFRFDKNAEDQRFSRLMNLREWIGKSAVVTRAYEYTPHIGDVFVRLMVTQEEFVGVTSIVPRDKVQFGHMSDLSPEQRAYQRSRYKTFDTDAEADAYIESQVYVLKFADDVCTWGNTVRAGSYVVVPRQYVQTTMPGKPDHIQIMMKINDLRMSNLDLNYTDWKTVSDGANDKYAFVADKLGDWFDSRGTITMGDAGKKSFADIRAMEGHDKVPLEKTAFYLETLRKQASTLSPNMRAFATGFGIKTPIDFNAATEVDRNTREFVTIATLTDADCAQWGFAAFFHQPNDYLIGKLRLAGGTVYVDVDGNADPKQIVSFDLLREMVRSRDGKNVPVLLSDAIAEYDRLQGILLNPHLSNADRKDYEGQALKQTFFVQVELFKIALDLHLERYVYQGMRKNQSGTFITDNTPLRYTYHEKGPHGSYVDRSMQVVGRYVEDHPIAYGQHHEIETISQRPPLDFIDREVFIQSVIQYCNRLVTQWGDKAPNNFPDRQFLIRLMLQKGIIGTSLQAETDRKAMLTKSRYGSVPDRVERQEENTSNGGKKSH